MFREGVFISKEGHLNLSYIVLTVSRGEFSKMKCQTVLESNTVPKKYVKNHAGAKILAAGYTKGIFQFLLSMFYNRF